MCIDIVLDISDFSASKYDQLLHPTGPLKGSILGKFSGCHQAPLSQKFTLQEKKKGVTECD